MPTRSPSTKRFYPVEGSKAAEEADKRRHAKEEGWLEKHPIRFDRGLAR